MRSVFSLTSALGALSIFLAAAGLGSPSFAQSSPPENGTALNLTIGEVGVSIGDSERTTGLRLNDRDRHLQRVTGVNLTLRAPQDEASGTVNGLAVGLPLTGANRLRGIGLGGGLAMETAMDGIAVGAVGLGSGERIRGIAVGGLGVGAGGRADGLLVGGLGAGAGSAVNGVLLGGLGAGAGDRANGVLVGGLGAGAGEDASGLLIGGLGAGAGDRATGLFVGGLGAGAGETVTGVGLSLGGVAAGDHLAGIGVGGVGLAAGNRLSGIGIGGVGIATGDAITGLAVAGASVITPSLTGVSVAGGYTRTEDGPLRGAVVSAYNDIRGPQHGLSIGLYNYTRALHGVQLGLINVARNNPDWARVLPVLNLNL